MPIAHRSVVASHALACNYQNNKLGIMSGSLELQLRTPPENVSSAFFPNPSSHQPRQPARLGFKLLAILLDLREQVDQRSSISCRVDPSVGTKVWTAGKRVLKQSGVPHILAFQGLGLLELKPVSLVPLASLLVHVNPSCLDRRFADRPLEGPFIEDLDCRFVGKNACSFIRLMAEVTHPEVHSENLSCMQHVKCSRSLLQESAMPNMF